MGLRKYSLAVEKILKDAEVKWTSLDRPAAFRRRGSMAQRFRV